MPKASRHARNGTAKNGRSFEGLWGGQDVITANLLAQQMARLGVLGQEARGMTRNDVESPFTTGVPLRGIMDAVLDPRRSVDEECGYPVSDSGNASNIISPHLFRMLYDREPVANRVVQVMPKECFQVEPLIYESDDEDKVTPFEEGLDDLSRGLLGARSWYENQGSPLIGYLQRLDCLSRIGHFGIMLIGIDDGKNLDQPVDGVSTTDPLGDREKYLRTRMAFESKEGKGFQSGGDDKTGSMPSMGGLGSKVDGQWSAGQPDADGSQVQEPKSYAGDWTQWERTYDQGQQGSDNGGDLTQPAWKGPVSGPGHSTSNQLARLVANSRRMGARYFDRLAGPRRVKVGKCGHCKIVVNVSAVQFKNGHPKCPRCKAAIGKLRFASEREINYGDRDGAIAANARTRVDPLGGWCPSVPVDAPHADEVAVWRVWNKDDADKPENVTANGLPQFAGWQKANDRRIMAAADLHRANNGAPPTVNVVHLADNTSAGSPGSPTNNGPAESRKDAPDPAAIPAYQDAGHTVQLASGAVGTDAQYVGVQLGPSEYPAHGAMTGPGERPRILFLRNFSEDLCQIVQYEANVRNPRFGMPVMYRVTLNDPREMHSGIGLPMATVRVHWSRVIHVNDVHANPGSSEIFSPPAMRPVLNRLLDLRKLYGAGAEGYWQAALTILQFVTHPQLGGDVLMDTTGLQNQVQNVINSLQRYLMSAGGQWQNIAPDIKDNSNFVERCVEAICICLAIPKRVFLGSERGELASSQDDAKWNDVIRERQTNYVTPRIIVVTIDRFILMGVLPEPESYKVEWPDLDSQTDKDKAGIALQKTQALQMYVMGNLETIIPLVPYLVHVWGFSQDQAEEIEAEASSHQDEDQFTQPDYGEPGHPATSSGGGENEGGFGAGGGMGGEGKFGAGAPGGGGPPGGGGAAADENANAIKQAQGKMQDEEKTGQDVSNAKDALGHGSNARFQIVKTHMTGASRIGQKGKDFHSVLDTHTGEHTSVSGPQQAKRVAADLNAQHEAGVEKPQFDWIKDLNEQNRLTEERKQAAKMKRMGLNAAAPPQLQKPSPVDDEDRQDPDEQQDDQQDQRDAFSKMMEEKQEAAEAQRQEAQDEADEHRSDLEGELGDDDVDDARQAAQEAVSQRIGNDPKRALAALRDDNIEWADIDPDELKKRVAALALAPAHALQELQADLAQEVTDKTGKRDDSLDKAEELGQAGKNKLADFHAGRADRHHQDAVEAKARLEAVQTALEKQGKGQVQNVVITREFLESGRPNSPFNKLAAKIGLERARQVVNAVERLARDV